MWYTIIDHEKRTAGLICFKSRFLFERDFDLPVDNLTEKVLPYEVFK